MPADEAPPIDAALARSQQRQALLELKEAVGSAFAGVTLGTGTGLYEAMGIDDWADEAAFAAYRALDQKIDWRAIPAAHLHSCSCSLSYFDAEGMRFHLPAFLIAEIDNSLHDEAEEGVGPIGLAHTLTKGPLDDRFFLLTERQRQVVRAYLRFVAQDEAHAYGREQVRAALAGYWAR